MHRAYEMTAIRGAAGCPVVVMTFRRPLTGLDRQVLLGLRRPRLVVTAHVPLPAEPAEVEGRVE